MVQPLSREWLRGPAWVEGDAIAMDCRRAEPYQPLADPKVGLALARVRTPPDAVAFASRFGLLRSTKVPVPGLSRKLPLTMREPFSDFAQAADDLRRIIKTASDVRRAVGGDADALHRLRERFHRFDDDGLFYVPNATDVPESFWHARTVDDRTILLRAGNNAAWGLRDALIHTKPYIYDRAYEGESVSPGLFRIGILPETLREVCYLQVAFALAEKEPLEICPECERAFVVDDARQRFCSPKCASRARFRRFKEHKKQRSTRKGLRHVKTTRTRRR